jgi:hypothetical protein
MHDLAIQGLNALPADVAALISAMQRELLKQVEERLELERMEQRKEMRGIRAEIKEWRDVMVSWGETSTQQLDRWSQEETERLNMKEDIMRGDFEKMFDEAMNRRTRELAVMRKESRILTWFSLALEISKANNPNLRDKDNSTISLPDLEREVSNVNKAKFRMKQGKFGTDLLAARRC